MTCLLTTSGIGGRLGSLTEHTNKCLLPVGDKPVISHIIDWYPEDTEFVITLGYKGDIVREYLELAYPEKTFQFVSVDKYEGPGSSLVYSMWCARSFLQKPFIFHTSDSVINTESFAVTIISNWVMYGTQPQSSSQYRGICKAGNALNYISEKGEVESVNPFIGIFGIYDYELFWNNCETVIAELNVPSDADVINRITREYHFQCVPCSQWYDTGNIESLNKTREVFQSDNVILEKSDQSIFFLKDTVIKYFSDIQKTSKLALRAGFLKGLVPEIIQTTNHFIKYRKAPGDLLLNKANPINFYDFLCFCQNNLWQYAIPAKSYEECKDFYYNKTLKRLKEFKDKTHIEDCDELINGRIVPSLEVLFDNVPWRLLFSAKLTSTFHGDLHLSNVLINEGKFTLLDWRESFGSSVTAGDVYYDLAKINHGLIVSHDLVEDNLFTITSESSGITIDILRHNRIIECQKVFYKFCKDQGYSIKKIDLLTAIIYLNICPLHHYPYNLFLYYLGKSMLFDVITQE